MEIKASALKSAFENKEYDEKLEALYADAALVDAQRARYVAAIDEFIALFGDKDVEIYSAAGRTEVGGNHTDHQRGRVLAASVNIDTIAVVSKRSDKTVVMKSEGYPEITVDLEKLDIDESEFGTSVSLIRGVAAGLNKRGYKIGGFEGYATSQVLSGSGLSSSAAYEVLIGNILSGMYSGQVGDPVMLAMIGQEAENQFFGKPSGLMDQMACSVGGLIHIDFFDKENPVVSKVDVDFGGFGKSLCIVDSKASHADLTDEYAYVPQEMRSVAAYFGKELLCEVPEEDFVAAIPDVRLKTSDRAVLRSIHWYEDCKRVDAQKDALEKGDFAAFGKLIRESGDSSFKYLQNVYAPKTGDQSLSIALAMTEKILGPDIPCRVHGGGFAGTIQVFVDDADVARYKSEIEKIFGEGSCHVLKIRPVGGCQVI